MRHSGVVYLYSLMRKVTEALGLTLPRAAPGVRSSGAVYIYSLIGEIAEVPAHDVLFRGVTLQGWWLNVWLESLPAPQRSAALQARPCLGLHGRLSARWRRCRH